MVSSILEQANVLRDALGDQAAQDAMAAALDAAVRLGPVPAGALPAAVGDVVAEAVARMPPALLARLATVLPVAEVAAWPAGFRATTGDLPALEAEGVPGLSVVTCCMNRTQNLLRALPSWLQHPAVSEVIVVDWSSDASVETALAEAGLEDPRVKIVRVEGEARWILSHAFNAGFRAASCAHILKADADIVLAPDFFARTAVPDDGFVAGNWRRAEEGQAYVNGFFLAPRKALAAVGGFNDYIRSYGWDDDELYGRLVHHGFRRLDIAPGTVRHLDHDDAARLGQTVPDAPASLAETLAATPSCHIRTNRFIAAAMPDWTARSPAVPFRILASGPNRMVLRRGSGDPSRVPPHVQAAAAHHALIQMGARTLGRDLLFLDPAVALELLDRPEAQVTRLDVLLALQGRMDVVRGTGAYVLLRTEARVLQDEGSTAPGVLGDLVGRLRAQGFRPVFLSALPDLPDPVRQACGDVALLAEGANTGPATAVLPRLAYQGGLPQDQGVLRMAIGDDTLVRLARLAQRREAPTAAPPD
jgi:hypothetical protein